MRTVIFSRAFFEAVFEKENAMFAVLAGDRQGRCLTSRTRKLLIQHWLAPVHSSVVTTRHGTRTFSTPAMIEPQRPVGGFVQNAFVESSEFIRRNKATGMKCLTVVVTVDRSDLENPFALQLSLRMPRNVAQPNRKNEPARLGLNSMHVPGREVLPGPRDFAERLGDFLRLTKGLAVVAAGHDKRPFQVIAVDEVNLLRLRVEHGRAVADLGPFAFWGMMQDLHRFPRFAAVGTATDDRLDGGSQIAGVVFSPVTEDDQRILVRCHHHRQPIGCDSRPRRPRKAVWRSKTGLSAWQNGVWKTRRQKIAIAV